MRIAAPFLALLIAASSSTAGLAQESSKRGKAAPKSEAAAQAENTGRLLWDALPLAVPMPVMLYMLQQKSKASKKADSAK
jgi:hypothetical protein